MNIAIEIIPSTQSNSVFQRINPITHLENGMIFSASNQAKYELINGEDGEIKEDGRNQFTNDKDLEVSVSYKNLEKTVVIGFIGMNLSK